MTNAVVDAEDAPLVEGYRWSLTVGYALTKANNVTLYMHRLVMGLDPNDGLQVDHKNFDGLDCTRANLRIATHAQNQQNRQGAWGSSGYRGVSFDKARGLWRAYASLNGHMHNLGRYNTEQDAANAAALFRHRHMPFSADAAIAPPHAPPPPRQPRRGQVGAYVHHAIRYAAATTTLTGRELAEMFGVSECTVSHVRSGKRPAPVL